MPKIAKITHVLTAWRACEKMPRSRPQLYHGDEIQPYTQNSENYARFDSVACVQECRDRDLNSITEIKSNPIPKIAKITHVLTAWRACEEKRNAEIRDPNSITEIKSKLYAQNSENYARFDSVACVGEMPRSRPHLYHGD